MTAAQGYRRSSPATPVPSVGRYSVRTAGRAGDGWEVAFCGHVGEGASMGTAELGEPSRLPVGGWVRAQPNRRGARDRFDSASSTTQLPVGDDDADGDVPVGDLDQYRGRRRAPGTLGRRAKIVILVLLVLAGGGLLLRSFMPADPPGAVGVNVPGQLPAVAGATSDPSTSDSTEPSASPAPSGSAGLQPSGAGNLTPSPSLSTTAAVPPRVPSASYEAESSANTLSGTAQVRSEPAASGGRVVTGLGDNPGNTLRFNGVMASRTGTYTLTIYYVSPELRRVYLEVNGVRAGSVDCGATGSGTIGSVTVSVSLHAGRNTIQFYNVRSVAPDLDRIVLR